MKKLILISIFSFSLCYAENTKIIECNTVNKEWGSLFVVDAVGNAYVKFQKSGDKNLYTCDLKIEYFNDSQRVIVPSVTVEFKREVCTPDLGGISDNILDRFILILDITQKKQPKGRIQWLKNKQPDECIVEKLRMFDVSHNSKKWIMGTWGRKTASEPVDKSKNKKSDKKR